MRLRRPETGKMKKKKYGFLAAGNLNIECLGETRRMENAANITIC